MSGLDNAASAFESDMGGGTSNGGGEVKESRSVVDISDVFPHMGGQDTDDENPSSGGGDDLPLNNKKPARVRAEVEDEELDPEAFAPDGEELDPDAEDGNDDPEDDPDPDAEDDADKDDKSEVFEVIVDGEPVEVSLDEALQGYIRTETFSRRMNKLNEAETLVATAADVVIKDRAKYVSLIDELETQVAALIPAEPNWDDLFAQDPVKARKLQKDYSDMQGKIAALKEAKQKAQQENQDELNRRTQQWRVGHAQRLGKIFPSWTDPEKGSLNQKRDVEAMAKTARAAGFSEEEIINTHDSRMIQVLHKAAAYDRIVAKRPQPKRRGSAPIASSGAGSGSRTAPKGNARNQKQLARSGKVRDAEAVFADIIKRSR